jgi:hypothetical protein
VSGAITGWLRLLLTCGVTLCACSWHDSVLTVRGGGGTGGSDAGSPAIPSCPASPGAPPGVAPLPAPAQVAFQRAELAALLHFGLGTFDGTEYGNAAVDTPSLFNPTNLDAGQ